MKKIPQHVVLFPDGNRRWSEQHGISIQDGYIKGKDKFNDFLRWCKNREINVVTVFGFSSENWRRPQDQVDFLMDVFEKYLGDGIDEFVREGVMVRVIGQREKLSKSLLAVVDKVQKATKNNKKLYLNLAVSYGGKWDIINAVKKIIEEKIPAENINEETFENYLSTAGQPAPDLIIRAGKEIRLSNFILWQAAYAELYFSDKLWPDFQEEDLDKALNEFDKRQRRFGGN